MARLAGGTYKVTNFLARRGGAKERLHSGPLSKRWGRGIANDPRGRRPYQSGLARLVTCQPALTVRALGITPKLWDWATYSGWVCCAAQVCVGNDTATGVGDDNARGA